MLWRDETKPNLSIKWQCVSLETRSDNFFFSFVVRRVMWPNIKLTLCRYRQYIFDILLWKEFWTEPLYSYVCISFSFYCTESVACARDGTSENLIVPSTHVINYNSRNPICQFLESRNATWFFWDSRSSSITLPILEISWEDNNHKIFFRRSDHTCTHILWLGS